MLTPWLRPVRYVNNLFKKENVFSWAMKDNIKSACPECGCAIVVSYVGELVCSSCGLVIEQTPLQNEERFGEKYITFDERVFGNLRSTVVAGSFIDADGPNRALAKTNAKSLGKNSTFIRGVELIKQVCVSLKLGKNIERQAIYLLSIGLQEVKKRLNLTVSSMVGACVLYAVREATIPVTSKEIYDSLKLRKKRATTAKMMKAYRFLIEVTGVEPSKSTTQDFAQRIVNAISNTVVAKQIDREMLLKKLFDLTQRVLDTIPSEIKVGKNPYVFAACSVYYCMVNAKLMRYTTIKNARDFARLSSVTEYSLNEHYKILNEHARHLFIRKGDEGFGDVPTA